MKEDPIRKKIVQQISAVKAGLDSAVQLILEDLVEDCVAVSAKSRAAIQTAVELKEVVARIR